jgi:hypothetical protein
MTTPVEMIKLGCSARLSFAEIDERVMKAFPPLTVKDLIAAYRKRRGSRKQKHGSSKNGAGGAGLSARRDPEWRSRDAGGTCTDPPGTPSRTGLGSTS